MTSPRRCHLKSGFVFIHLRGIGYSQLTTTWQEGGSMTVEEARRLFAYNDWANGRLTETLKRLSPEKTTATVPSSFSSLRDTYAHILMAEWNWLRRWLRKDQASPPRAGKDGTVNEVAAAFSEIQADRNAFLARLSETDLAVPDWYRETRGPDHAYSLEDMFRHVVNHSAYHRGQAATQLRQLGEAPSGTDFILFVREGR
jgi:uncharacterized damage-inducible protein DinB